MARHQGKSYHAWEVWDKIIMFFASDRSVIWHIYLVELGIASCYLTVAGPTDSGPFHCPKKFWPIANRILIQIYFICRNWLYLVIIWCPGVTSTELGYNLCRSVTFNPNCESRVFVDSGYSHCPGHVVALIQSQPRIAPVALFWRLYSIAHVASWFTLGELEEPPKISHGMDICWELPPRMRSRTLLAHYPASGCLPEK